MGEVYEVIDWQGLLAQFRGRDASVLKVVATALRTQSDVPAILRALQQSVDYPALARQAHSIKGMAGSLMANRVYEQAKRVDELAKACNPEALAQSEQLAQLTEDMLAALAVHVANADRNSVGNPSGS